MQKAEIRTLGWAVRVGHPHVGGRAFIVCPLLAFVQGDNLVHTEVVRVRGERIHIVKWIKDS